MLPNSFKFTGLSDKEVAEARTQHGFNRMPDKEKSSVLKVLKDILKEPMVALLLAASGLYLLMGEKEDAIFLACATILVTTISLYQDNRSKNALVQLKKFTFSKCNVIRNAELISIQSEELVPGDYLVVEEGELVAADGTIVQANDFTVNESILTGESLPFKKGEQEGINTVFQGTTALSGLAIVIVTHTGAETQLGKIGKSLSQVKEEKTPLETQINAFVKKMVIIGVVFLVLIWGINYFKTGLLLDSLLKALTLAMSILPEEIPVAFTTFMALGSWRLMKLGIVVKQMKTVETLGSASVICIDKTGTITENEMTLASIYHFKSSQVFEQSDFKNEQLKELINYAMWASEPIPFDAMEKALHQAYSESTTNDQRPFYSIAHEYPLAGKPPMMTHLFENKEGSRIIAAKGAPEAFLAICSLSADEKNKIEVAMHQFTTQGFRVLGVAKTTFEGNNFPELQQQFNFDFLGLVAFYDPPKKNIADVLQHFYNAHIQVKIITGDNPETTKTIAKQIQFKGWEHVITGNELMQLSDLELQKVVSQKSVFTRMFPEAKLRIINALKANGEIVAMTGDGVNDGPALKAAHIGIAMGKKGTELAKQAASLILVDDDLYKMVDAIKMGRKIYSNLKKAIQYIISIHIPIILIVFLPLVLGWLYPSIFSPVHVIFLELIMGPTCSIIYENEPAEINIMTQAPKNVNQTLFSFKDLSISIIQGVAIALGLLLCYQYGIQMAYNESMVRTLVFISLISANITLTLVNRSFYYSIWHTLKFKNNLVGIIISITVILSTLIIEEPHLAHIFEFTVPNFTDLTIALFIGITSVIWLELVKLKKRRNG